MIAPPHERVRWRIKRALRRCVLALVVPRVVAPPHEIDRTAEDTFLAAVGGMPAPRMALLAPPDDPDARRIRARLPAGASLEYLWREEGSQVDRRVAPHALSDTLGASALDGLIVVSTLESVTVPWLAALDWARVLKPGGHLLVGAHHSWALDAWTPDLWRLTPMGLESLFTPAMGFGDIRAHSQDPCFISCAQLAVKVQGVASLSVWLTARKVAETPPDFPYEFGEEGQSEEAREESQRYGGGR